MYRNGRRCRDGGHGKREQPELDTASLRTDQDQPQKSPGECAYREFW
jgi:hypothetical protein